MKKQLVIFLSAFLAAAAALGQDIHFSQYYVAPQLINPAAFGVLNSYEAGVQYKGQWNSFTNGYTSAAAFANKSFKNMKDANSTKAYASAGLNVIYDKAGMGQLTQFKAEIPVNVTKRLSSTAFLTGGLYVGFGQLGIKNDSYTWGNQFNGYEYNSSINSNEANYSQTKTYLDCGAGLSYVAFRKDIENMSTPLNIAGLSVAHLNQPDNSLFGMGTQRLGMRVSLYDYYYYYIKGTPLSIVPSILAQYQSNAYEVVIGGYIRKTFGGNSSADAKPEAKKTTKAASIGLFYRLRDVFAVNCMLEMSSYSLGINYDFNVSKLITSSRSFGGLELALKMKNPFQYTYKSKGSIREKF